MKQYDMKLSKQERKDASPKVAEASSGGPDYPWGLELNLNDDTLEKLGISKFPQVGKKIRIQATAEVVGVSQNQNRDAQKDRSVRLQIIKMGYESAPQSMQEAVEDGIEAAE